MTPDDGQWKVIWMTLGATFFFWLLGQASESGNDERFWNGVAGFTLVAGFLRLWMLEGRKPKPPGAEPPSTA